MSKRIYITETVSGGLDIDVPPTILGEFKELIQRGANLWPDAPPEIKLFADLVTSGLVMQNYFVQDTSRKKENI